MTTTLNLRRHLYLTNTMANRPGPGRADLLLPTEPTFIGTPRQILDEIQDFRRLSGGCDIAVRILDPRDGSEISRDDLRCALTDAECAREGRRGR